MVAVASISGCGGNPDDKRKGTVLGKCDAKSATVFVLDSLTICRLPFNNRTAILVVDVAVCGGTGLEKEVGSKTAPAVLVVEVLLPRDAPVPEKD